MGVIVITTVVQSASTIFIIDAFVVRDAAIDTSTVTGVLIGIRPVEHFCDQ